MSTAFDIRPREKNAHTPRPRPMTKNAPVKTDFTYYDYGPVLSRNGTYNFIIGGRGLGKTFGAKKLALDRWFNRGDQFMYVRRYKDELVDRDKFFDDLGSMYPDWDFRALGNSFETAPASTVDEKHRPWETIGFAVALSVGQKKKSVAYPNVKLIIFDEFIIEKGVLQYLPNEADVFNNLYSTVDRWMDKTQVLFLANAASISNPYFIRYRLAPDPGTVSEWVRRSDGFVIAHYPPSTAFKSQVAQTKFGKFIAGTEYAQFAIGNEFHDNTGHMVKPKSARARHLMNLETRLGWISVWADIHAGGSGEYWAYSIQPSGAQSYTLLPENVNDNRMLLMYNDALIDRLKYHYRIGRLHFDEDQTQATFMDLFKRR